MTSRDDLVSRFSSASHDVLEVRGKRYPISSCFIDIQATDGRRRWVVITNGEEDMGTEHEKNDDNDNDGSSGTSDGHDHFEEEDSE